MSWLSKLFGGNSKGGEIQTISTLSPEQQRLLQRLAPYVQERIGQGLPAYTGQYIAGLSPYEQTGLDILGKYLAQSPTAGVAGVGLGTYADLLKTATPAGAEEWWQQYRRPQWERTLTEDILPAIKEAKVAPGTLYGTPYSTMAGEAIEKWGESAQADIGTEIQRRAQLATSLLPYLGTMREMEVGVPQMEAAMSVGQLPRMLEQMDLAAKYEEFKRTTPELSPILDLAMNLLNVQTMAAYGTEAQPSGFMQMLGPVAQVLGSWLGRPKTTSTISTTKS